MRRCCIVNVRRSDSLPSSATLQPHSHATRRPDCYSRPGRPRASRRVAECADGLGGRVRERRRGGKRGGEEGGEEGGGRREERREEGRGRRGGMGEERGGGGVRKGGRTAQTLNRAARHAVHPPRTLCTPPPSVRASLSQPAHSCALSASCPRAGSDRAPSCNCYRPP